MPINSCWNLPANNSAWTRADRQTVSENGKVDHAASAKANAQAAAKNLSDIFTPNHFTDLWDSSEGGSPFFGPLLAFAGAPFLAAAEVADVVTGPVKAAKNAADAVAHKVADWF